MRRGFGYKRAATPGSSIVDARETNSTAAVRHGFGLRANDPKPAGKWLERLKEWLADGGFLGRP
jgi:hypothetical protein